MVGRAVELTVHKDAPQLDDRALVVEGLTRDRRRSDQIVVNDVSFDVRGGEILAIAGRAGQRPDRARPRRSSASQHRVRGSVTLNGEELVGASVRRILDEGVGFVPEDRNEDGLVGAFTIAENLMLDRSNGAPFVRGGNLQRSAARASSPQEKFREFDVRAPGHRRARSGTLSGGNQQKVVLARELSRELSLLVAAQPTRGVDVGSIEFIHKRIVETRDAGIPVIVVSTELDEVAALADRIMVMYRGRIVGIVPGDTPREVLGLMMAGEAPDRRGVAA